LIDLCVAAALDALKESVKLPWETGRTLQSKYSGTTAADSSEKSPTKANSTPGALSSIPSSMPPFDSSSAVSASTPLTEASLADTTASEGSEPESTVIPKRILTERHFASALMSITPSSSETQGSLSELRKWDTQYGTGARNRPGVNIPKLQPSSIHGSNGYSGSTGARNYGANNYPSYGSTGIGSTPRASTYSSTGIGPTFGGRTYPSATTEATPGGMGLSPANLNHRTAGASYPFLGTSYPLTGAGDLVKRIGDPSDGPIYPTPGVGHPPVGTDGVSKDTSSGGTQ
jgi:hypothetical protein